MCVCEVLLLYSSCGEHCQPQCLTNNCLWIYTNIGDFLRFYLTTLVLCIILYFLIPCFFPSCCSVPCCLFHITNILLIPQNFNAMLLLLPPLLPLLIIITKAWKFGQHWIYSWPWEWWGCFTCIYLSLRSSIFIH